MDLLLYSNVNENLAVIYRILTVTLQNFNNYLKICDDKMNNGVLYNNLANKSIIILNLINSFVLNTTCCDALINSEQLLNDLISLKGNVLANAFQLIELNQCVNINQNSSKSLVIYR